MISLYGDSDFDTFATTRLREAINRHNIHQAQVLDELKERERSLASQYDQLMLHQRPEYPTAPQAEKLRTIAELVRTGTPYGDTHGYPVGPDQRALALPSSLHYCSSDRRINLFAGAPYSVLTGGRLWTISDDDVARVVALLDEEGLEVTEQRRTTDGYAFCVAPKTIEN
jgi:hypothetical protein